MSAPLLSFDAHLAGIAAATERVDEALRMSWPGAPVPTCPGWQLLDLVAHLGMVHRWATAALIGDEATMADSARLEAEGRMAQHLDRWLGEGSTRLREALLAAPDDLHAMVFLKEAPPAKLFWARRQCHETTLHAVDAVAAQGERAISAHDAWFDAELAADGVDELVIGFWQRSRSAHRSPTPYAVLLRPTDVAHAWVVEVDQDGTRSRRVYATDTTYRDSTDHEVSGSAVDLYLALWHRGGDVDDEDGVLERWGSHGIRW